MGTINLTYRPTPKSIGGFVIDAFIEEKYTFENEVTDVPVEEGVNITDHVVEKADKLHISAFIGKTEFMAYDGDVPDDFRSLSDLNEKGRIIMAYKELRRMKSERMPITVTMGLDTFPNMIITSFVIGRDAETGADLAFEMSFSELKTAKSQAVEINSAQLLPSAADQAAPEVNMGTASTEIAPFGSKIWKEANANLDAIGIRGEFVSFEW